MQPVSTQKREIHVYNMLDLVLADVHNVDAVLEHSLVAHTVSAFPLADSDATASWATILASPSGTPEGRVIVAILLFTQ